MPSSGPCKRHRGAGSRREEEEGGEEDPRLAELREINARLTTVISFLEAKQTPRSIESAIVDAEVYLDDHTPAFVRRHNSGGAFEGTRHVGSLLTLCDLLEVKAEMGQKDALTECTSLLERKVTLLREVYQI
jgi:hypothetical protein